MPETTSAPHPPDLGVRQTLEHGVLRITIDRPTQLNAVTGRGLDAIATAFESAAADPTVRTALLTGTGRAFCTGVDLSTSDALTGPDSSTTLDAANRAVAAIRAFPRPVVAAVNGPAAGIGVSLALISDLTIATRSAYFLLAFSRIGLMPDGGATALVEASIGRARAMKMALLAERVTAEEAVRTGLIAAEHDDASFGTAVDNLVRHLAGGPTLAYERIKNAVNEATIGQLDDAFSRERQGQLALAASEDFKAGLTAFLEKSEPNFRGS
ncbi:enoyl-CoA hydratase [Rhodococcus aetherivorans]|uniref:enoyl-CoA hydratase n=1 Tax=Rhodococcus aetherivorans TaxID=191292 RepID=UPI0002D22E58|nr:enoyl-CoA hydratase [Rhodococcus aetherivorans]CCW14903.1 Enoyl-CoA hydratase [Rhodococcus aetherivorans]